MELFCPEDGNLLSFSDEEDENNEIFIFSQDKNEHIQNFVSKEISFSNSTHSSCADQMNCERFESVHWIINMKNCFGFSPQTAFHAVNFLDRFLLRRTIDEGKIWAMKLLSIACLSLAAKMEESSAPLLSAYQFKDYRFSSKVTQRMELIVLDTLEWRLHSDTPFTYLSYFASKFNFDNCSKKLLPIAIEFIFVVVKAMNLIDYRPSTIAAAAIFAASGEKSTEKLFESNNNVVSLAEPLERKEKTRSQKVLNSLEISSNCAIVSNLNDFIEIADLSASTSKKKRRRLLSDESAGGRSSMPPVVQSNPSHHRRNKSELPPETPQPDSQSYLRRNLDV